MLFIHINNTNHYDKLTLCNLQAVSAMFQVGSRSLLLPSCSQVSHDQILKKLNIHAQEIKRKIIEKKVKGKGHRTMSNHQ